MNFTKCVNSLFTNNEFHLGDYGAPFVNLLFNLFLDDFVMIYYLIYDNSAQWLNYHK